MAQAAGRSRQNHEYRPPGAAGDGAELLMTTLDQLMYGIRQVESGGNYSVVNSIGAVGAYQILQSNVPEWTRQALGYSMSWQQFRDSRAAQDAVARYKLGIFLKRYGAQGAASMWFSGQPNPNSTASD